MSNTSTQVLLQRFIGPLYERLLHPDVEEIAINKPGEIWVRRRRPDEQGRQWIPEEAPDLTGRYLENICHMVANLQNIPNFGAAGMPVVFGTVPGGHRFAAGIGPNIQSETPEGTSEEGSICVCVRQYNKEQTVDLQDYGITPGQRLRPPVASIFTRATDPDDPFAQIVNSLTRGDHILLSGATSSGKTTFLNRLVSFLDDRKRILTVEDTREIRVLQPNRVHILMSRTQQANKFDYRAVRDLIVRMTPDVVMAGEISNSNAATIWELMTTGHGHFMTTIHARSPDEALTTFINCISNARSMAGNTDAIDRDELRAQMVEHIRVIQIEKDSLGQRRISAVA
ncbi:ATPase, T2SS/T4P/T4SS family [Microvirga yunnanensis]|uniref:ATPase, T2SS/T4P/T4SS family n=2 Tax=Microvirga TaxID=186650 RepID=UPI0021C8F6FB|nr:ATPase, T2SS/T4P/T4SS family [Microvirga sp. HBU65207]